MSQIESSDRIEPCLLDDLPRAIADLVTAVTRASAQLGARLPQVTALRLAELVRVMNCYYSNLIEGHNTMPRDIERALANDLDTDPRRRNLQVEARAHIRLQAEIDHRHSRGDLDEPADTDFIRWLHAEFYRDAPAEMLRLQGSGRVIDMIPGRFRSPEDGEVAVGRHLPPTAGAVPGFMAHFAARYRFANLGPAQQIIACAAAHHRFNYIHPYADGNGRVSRLMSHAMALKAGIGAHGLWSIARGMARGLADRGEYKRMMDLADTPRQGDLDGRGNLSRRALAEFVEWLLRVMLDQVEFMSGLFDLDGLAIRFKLHVQRDANLHPQAFAILDEVLRRGEMPRGAAGRVTGLGERAARDVLAQLVAQGLLGSDSAKSPVSLRFPVQAVDALFPKLFIASAN